MLLTDIIKHSRSAYPDNVALLMRPRYRTISLTYTQVYELSLSVAHILSQMGVRQGDKVLLQAPNSPYWVCVFWGCLFSGAVIVPVYMETTRTTIQLIHGQTKAKVMVLKDSDQNPHIKGLSVITIDKLIERAYENSEKSLFIKAKSSDIAEIVYTSGTTGDPKGVVLTHANITSNIKALLEAIPISKNDRFLSVLPASHMFEQAGGFLAPFYKGSTIVFAHSRSQISSLMREYGITKLIAVPALLSIFMNRIEAGALSRGKARAFRRLLSLAQYIRPFSLRRLLFSSVHKAFGGSLHTIASGGAPLDPKIERKWRALGMHVIQGYGLTETSPVATVNKYKAHRIGSVGRPVKGVQVKCAKDGEVLIKGPNVFSGYYKNVKTTREVFNKDGWFMSDDIGHIDDDGFLYIKGRKKYMILGPGGKNIYPEDIELVLNQNKHVEDSCVIGLQGKAGSIEIHAVLLMKEDSRKEPQQLIDETNHKLAQYQHIRGWSLWPDEDFPRTATRKIKKQVVIGHVQGSKKAHERKPVKSTPLIQLLKDVTGEKESRITPSTKLVPSLKIDSITRIALVVRIEEVFGVLIAESDITPKTTLKQLRKKIEHGKKTRRSVKLKLILCSPFAKLSRFILRDLVLSTVARIWVKLSVKGVENLKDLPLSALIMPNHLSYLDGLVLVMALPRRMRKRITFAAAQDTLYEGRFCRISWLVELLFHTVPFPRKEYQNIDQGLHRVGRLLDKGHLVGVFPEGRMSTTGKVGSLKRGAGLMAIEMKVPVVPVKIEGTDEVLPPGKLKPKTRGTINVIFGKPIEFDKKDSLKSATLRIEKALRRL